MSAQVLTGGMIAKPREDCLGEFEMRLTDYPGRTIAHALLTCYGRWDKGEPADFYCPGEPAGYEFTTLELQIGDERHDVTGHEWAESYAARMLADDGPSEDNAYDAMRQRQVDAASGV